MRKVIGIFVLVVLVLSTSPAAFAKTHRELVQASCDRLWPAVKDVVRNSGKYGIIGIDNTEMSISYNIGGGLGGKRINSVVLNRKGEDACEMQIQTAYSGLIHNDAGDFKDRVAEALAKAPILAEAPAKKQVTQETAKAAPSATQPAVVADPEHGVITLNANADAVQVSVDGKAVGTTPTRMQLTPGKHTIHAVLDGYDAWDKEIEVLAESEINLKIVLNKARDSMVGAAGSTK